MNHSQNAVGDSEEWLQGLNTPVVCLKNLINSYVGPNWSCYTIFSYVPCIESYTKLCSQN